MKKGFTLIELLAVIVILAVIAVIAVPIVLNIINDTKESATLRSADFYLDGVEQAIMLKNLNNLESFNPNICEIQSDGNLICDNKNTIEIKVDGEKPKDGTIKFEDNNISFAIVTNNYCVTKAISDTEFEISKDINNCVIPTKITDISFSDETVIVPVEETKTLSVIFEPSSATNKELKWETSDNKVATVENGVVTGVKIGNTTITVKTTDGSNLTKTINVKVVDKYSLIAVATTNEEVSDIHSCAIEGTCEPGTPFAIKVNDTETYKFYVLNDDGTSVDLIMSSNLGEDVMWNDEQYCYYFDDNGMIDDLENAEGEIYEECYASAGEGPVLALATLKQRTSTWKNLKEYSYELDFCTNTLYGYGYCEGETYSGEYVENIRARMPSLDNVSSFIVENWRLPFWLSEGGEYWLSDYATNNESSGGDQARFVMFYQDIVTLEINPINNTLGLRPVITIKK